MAATVLFVLAAAGGAFLNLCYQWKQRVLPKGIVVMHALVAAVGFILLVIATRTARR